MCLPFPAFRLRFGFAGQPPGKLNNGRGERVGTLAAFFVLIDD